mmetsp:Transcript_47165/g.109049  ORF Transcript_47165/g.109049 Transcript_47165/m.109049 type:complete len:504 (+) Transcript_47165:43-1554(+)
MSPPPKRALLALAAAPLLVAAGGSVTAPAEGITLLVRDQATAHDASLVEALVSHVMELGWDRESVVSMASLEEKLGHHGLWSYKPWVFWLHRRQIREGSKRRLAYGQRWFVFLEPTTMVDVINLGALLHGYDAFSAVCLGRALRDEVSSILHSYSQEPPYPLVHSGFAISGGLLRRLAQDLLEHPLARGGLHHPQQIEPAFELAQWVSSLGVKLTDRGDVLCTRRTSPSCATWIVPRREHRQSWGLTPQDIIIAVKTVASLHSSRIQHIHRFWGSSSGVEVLYLSNEAFSGVPGARVVDLSPEFGDLVDPGKESTRQGSGHCSKMEAMLKYLARHHPGKRWYIVTDDDTLLNVPQLLEVLNSHDDSEAIYLGERYGWAHREEAEGTNYVTTGGGVALSGPALAKLQACEDCTCHKPNAPDDMMLGTWFAGLGVPVVHEEGFHQAEPHNYHQDVLRFADPPVSFHRFAMQLPGSASEDEKTAARQQHWQAWVDKYFNAHWKEEL